MALTMNHGDAEVLAIQEAKLYREARRSYFWRNWVGYTMPQTQEMAAKKRYPALVKGKVVTVIPSKFGYTGGNKAVKGGGDRHILYGLKAIVGAGVSGDTQVMGTGNVSSLLVYDIYVNRKRREHVVSVGAMHDLRAGQWAVEVAKTDGPELMDWYQRWMSWYGVNHALLYKNSAHITESGIGEYAKGKVHHPNVMCLGLPMGIGDGYNFTTWSATAATYESALAKNIARVRNGEPACVLNATGLRQISLAAAERNITPLGMDDIDYILAVHYDQWFDLLQDEEFRTTLQHWSSLAQDQSKVFFAGASALFERMLIVKDWGGACEVFAHKEHSDGLSDSTITEANATKVIYGPLETIADSPYVGIKDMTSPTSVRGETSVANGALSALEVTRLIRDKRAALLLGENALACIQVQHPKFFNMDTDYGNRKTMDIDGIEAYARIDKYDDIDTPTEVQNNGSMIVITATQVHGGVV